MDEVDPSEINSFLLNKAGNTLVSEKKRKLQAEQLGLPISKHKCWDHCSPSESPMTPGEGRDVQSLIAKVIHENEEMQEIEDGSSDPESAKGSNSFIGDSDSAMSVHDVKFETEISKIWPGDRPSTSSAIWGGFNTPNGSLLRAGVSTGAGKEKQLYVAAENGPEIYEEEPILEFSPHLDYTFSEFGNEDTELPDKEINDFLFSNGVDSNVYVLSSGRWSINQDGQPGTRKPTIDQEFEQYFSTLML